MNDISPIVVAGYVELVGRRLQAPTVKMHLAAIRKMFDYLVVGQIAPANPVSSVRGPSHVVKKGRTPVLSSDEARQLLDSIDVRTISGLRDRALIGVMVFSFARVSAVVGMNVDDYFTRRGRKWFQIVMAIEYVATLGVVAQMLRQAYASATILILQKQGSHAVSGNGRL